MLKNIRKLARKDLTSLNKVISERAAMETAFSLDFLSRSSFIICRFPERVDEVAT